jgi:hypothetical protein
MPGTEDARLKAARGLAPLPVQLQNGTKRRHLLTTFVLNTGARPGFSIRLAVSDVLVNSTYRRVKIQLKLLSNESPSDATQSPMLEILRRDQPDRRVCAGFSAAEGHRRIAL